MNSAPIDKLEIKRFVVGPIETNCYLVYGSESKEAILIDPGAYDPAISDFIQDNGLNVLCIVNTHGHYDHIMANSDYGYPVLIHEEDEICLTDPRHSLSTLMGANTAPVKVVKVLKEGDVIKVGTLEFKVIHTPGHTRGGMSLLSGDILFSGDTLFFEGIGRTDLPGGDFETIMKSIKEKLLILPENVKVFPGHGPETTIGHEKKHNTLL